jgi:hypothetical protein
MSCAALAATHEKEVDTHHAWRHLCLLLHLHFPSASVGKPGKDNNEERMEDEATSGSQLARMALQILLVLLVLVRCKLFSILYFPMPVSF